MVRSAQAILSYSSRLPLLHKFAEGLNLRMPGETQGSRLPGTSLLMKISTRSDIRLRKKSTRRYLMVYRGNEETIYLLAFVFQ